MIKPISSQSNIPKYKNNLLLQTHKYQSNPLNKSFADSFICSNSYNPSFLGIKDDDKKELTDKEFKKKKEKIARTLDYLGASFFQKFFIFRNLRKDNINIAQILLSKKEQIKYIPTILKHTNKTTAPIINAFCNNNYTNAFISVHTKKLNAINQDFARELFEDGRIALKDICFTAAAFTKENATLARDILADEEFMNNPNEREELADILYSANRKTEALVRKLYNDETCPKEGIYDILKCLHLTKDKNFILELCDNKNISKTTIPRIAWTANQSNNINLAKELCNIKDFPNEEIPSILNATNKINYQLSRQLCNNADFPKNMIADILINTNKYNIEIATQLCTDKNFPKEEIVDILCSTDKYNLDFAKLICSQEYFPQKYSAILLSIITYRNRNNLCPNDKKERQKAIEFIKGLLQSYKEKELTFKQIVDILENDNKISQIAIKKANKLIGTEKLMQFDEDDRFIIYEFIDIYKLKNISEISSEKKKALLKKLVSSNAEIFRPNKEIKKLFPLLPQNQKEYCKLLPEIVQSIGIKTEKPDDNNIKEFNNTLQELSQTLNKISDNDFIDLKIYQTQSKEDFIKIILEKVKNLSFEERQKVYDYFGFELHHNRKNKTGFSIVGYPKINNDKEKLGQINNDETKEVINSLRQDIINFLTNNPIKSNNAEVETLLNKIAEILPEIRTQIGRKQFGSHYFDILKHSLKVMKKMAQSKEYKELNESDKKILLYSALLHDITKKEDIADPNHPEDSSFDTFFIAKRFKLTKEEEIKLYTIIKHHEWLRYVDTSKSREELIKRQQKVAYDLRHDNIFELSLIFTHADLKAVSADDYNHDTREGKNRIDYKGTVRSFGEAADFHAKGIKKYINELQKTQPILPVTKFPKASRIKSAITKVHSDGSTNIKGVYLDKNGLIIIKFNEVETWEKIGFPSSSISKGIISESKRNKEINTGTIKFFVHGLAYPNQLTKFDAFSLINSDALLSVSYATKPESKYRFFRCQGVILDTPTKYIHGGGKSDSGSGYEKNINDFKENYIFGGHRESERLFISNLIKKSIKLNDKQYVEFVKKYENKSFDEIEDIQLRNKIINLFASMEYNVRGGHREYNEFYISNPDVMGVFAYNPEYTQKIGNPIEFLNQKNIHQNTQFLKKYALERDLPFVVFGN